MFILTENGLFCKEEYVMAEGLEIIEVTGRRMLDSEGLPAVEAEVELENGAALW